MPEIYGAEKGEEALASKFRAYPSILVDDYCIHNAQSNKYNPRLLTHKGKRTHQPVMTISLSSFLHAFYPRQSGGAVQQKSQVSSDRAGT